MYCGEDGPPVLMTRDQGSSRRSTMRDAALRWSAHLLALQQMQLTAD